MSTTRLSMKEGAERVDAVQAGRGNERATVPRDAQLLSHALGMEVLTDSNEANIDP
jgi:hypothetical protein